MSSAHEVGELALDLGPGRPVVGAPGGIARVGTAGAEQRLLVAGPDHRLAVEPLDRELRQPSDRDGGVDGGPRAGQVRLADADAAARIALAIYREIRAAHDWGRQFPEAPSQQVLEKLAELTPREMRRAVQLGFGNAKLAGRGEVSPDDIQDGRGTKRSRIGF